MLVLEVVRTMSDEHIYSVYILASRPNGALYTGVANNLDKRVHDHREGRGRAFTKKYCVYKLMWFQDFTYVEDAIQREESIKLWPRAWKINLIERTNPDWHDLFPAMQKYEPKGPLTGARGTMGPRERACGLTPCGSPEDDT